MNVENRHPRCAASSPSWSWLCRYGWQKKPPNSKVQIQQQSPFNLSDESVSQSLSPPLSFSFFKKVHPNLECSRNPHNQSFQSSFSRPTMISSTFQILNFLHHLQNRRLLLLHHSHEIVDFRINTAAAAVCRSRRNKKSARLS